MWLVLSLAGFALAVLLHAVFTRMGGSLTIVLSFLGVSIPIVVVIAAVALWMFGVSDESIAAILVYLALCETYIFLFTLAANGVSVSLMMRLRSRPTTADALMKSYSTRAMVERRIDQLAAGGFLTEAGGIDPFARARRGARSRLRDRPRLFQASAYARERRHARRRVGTAFAHLTSHVRRPRHSAGGSTKAGQWRPRAAPDALVPGRRGRVPSLTSLRTTVAESFAPTRAGNRREAP